MFFSDYIKKRRTIMVKEADIITALKILDNVNSTYKFDILMDMEIGCMSDEERKGLWFISFTANNKKWIKILNLVYAMKHSMILGEDNEYYLM